MRAKYKLFFICIRTLVTTMIMEVYIKLKNGDVFQFYLQRSRIEFIQRRILLLTHEQGMGNNIVNTVFKPQVNYYFVLYETENITSFFEDRLSTITEIKINNEKVEKNKFITILKNKIKELFAEDISYYNDNEVKCREINVQYGTPNIDLTIHDINMDLKLSKKFDFTGGNLYDELKFIIRREHEQVFCYLSSLNINLLFDTERYSNKYEIDRKGKRNRPLNENQISFLESIPGWYWTKD